MVHSYLVTNGVPEWLPAGCLVRRPLRLGRPEAPPCSLTHSVFHPLTVNSGVSSPMSSPAGVEASKTSLGTQRVRVRCCSCRGIFQVAAPFCFNLLYTHGFGSV